MISFYSIINIFFLLWYSI